MSGETEPPRDQPQRIITSWRRFSSGLWRVPRGDIADAYSAETFPKIKVFTHEGRLYTSGGATFSGLVKTSASCYPLLPPDDYTGPTERRYSYEGRTARFGGKAVILGPEVTFESDDPTISEWITLIRAIYAHGGYFINGRTYEEFLTTWTEPPTERLKQAIAHELSEVHAKRVPNSQDAMESFLDTGTLEPSGAFRQPELAF